MNDMKQKVQQKNNKGGVVALNFELQRSCAWDGLQSDWSMHHSLF